MTPEPMDVLFDHAAPMLVRAGRGNGLGLFAVRQRTVASIRGVDRRELAEPREMYPAGVPGDAVIFDRAIWQKVKAVVAGAFVNPSLEDVRRLVGGPPGTRDAGRDGGADMLVGISDPPFRTRVRGPLRVAKAHEARGEVPPAAEPLVGAARAAASAAMVAHVGRLLLHDGEHLYARVPVPLLNQVDPALVTCRPMSGLMPVPLSHRRVGEDGRYPASWLGGQAFPPAHVGRLGRCMEGIDDGDADVERFVADAPPMLMPYLRSMGTPAGEALLERLWPMVLASELGQPPACGLDDAAEGIRAAAVAILDHPGDLGLDRNGRGAGNRRVLRNWRAFVEQVARPALQKDMPTEDFVAMEGLAP